MSFIYKGYEIAACRAVPTALKIGIGENKGSLPRSFQESLFTARQYAITHIDNYLLTRQKKESTNGETVSKGGSK